jgi:hypothetical protein
MFKGKFSDMTLPRTNLLGIYRGVVEDNSSDPKKAGRCKVRVFGVHSENKIKTPIDGIPTDELPWAEPACPIFGGISKIGIYGIPMQGAHVFVFFENGNILQPRYFATAPGIPARYPDTTQGFNDPDGEYPTTEHLNFADWNEGENNAAEYPNSFIIKAPSGHRIEMDSTPDEEKIIIQHGVTGANITFTKEGSIIISSKGNTNVERTGSKETSVTGNYTVRVSDEYTVISKNSNHQVMGSNTSMITGGKSETVLGVCDLKAAEDRIGIDGNYTCVAGGETDIISGGTITVKSKEALGGVKIQATLSSVDTLALVGITNKSLTWDAKALATFDATALITTTKGISNTMKGIIAKVEGSITIISGGIIMIG